MGRALDATVRLGPQSEVHHSRLHHVIAGRGCRIFHSVVEGTAEYPVILGDNVTLVGCHVRSTGEANPFAFCGAAVDVRQTRLEDGVSLSHAYVVNSVVGTASSGVAAFIEASCIGPHNALRRFANITRSRTAAHCQLGSELSKTLILGDGFTSEHQNAYLSLLAPAAYPILTAEGREALLTGLPNVSNIGAGTVFANYGGEPLPAPTLADSPGSAKGTAILYTAFVCINCRVVNRYGQPEGDPSPFDLLRRRDLTILGLCSFVENKLTGRIPAFSYAGDLSPRHHRLGWVLEKKPGLVLNFMAKMRRLLGSEAGRLRELIEGTLRLECQLLQEELEGKRPTFYSRAQLEEGLRIFHAQLQSGRWAMDEAGHWRHPWRFDAARQQWVCDVP
ncbi:MAG: hypothetical protein KatS3mg131_2602 [Candidatus Tectimicrobiota bacterium]|nr:MAG: hypothetical protein KatS3mg131_2602 [Candidatus Tectomicrobia bacterium]